MQTYFKEIEASKMELCIVAGARPNFMKFAPIVDAIKDHNRSNHQTIDYFNEDIDTKIGYIFADILSLYLIANLNYTLYSRTYKDAASKIVEVEPDLAERLGIG